MKILIPLMLFVSLNCLAQASLKSDTLLRVEKTTLLLNNTDFVIFPRFFVNGDIYIKNDMFIFHPKPYQSKRFEMYNDLTKDIIVYYPNIIKIKKTFPIRGLKIITETKKYKIEIAYRKNQKNRRAALSLIKKLMADRK